MTGLIIGLLLVAFVTLVLGVFNIQWNFFVRATHRATTSSRQIALTFDDGPHPMYTPQVLTQLEKHGIEATFFCIGKHAAAYPYLVRELHRRNHVIGNHSFTHASTIDFHTRTKWLMEIRQTDDVIEQTLGKRPRFFRPPYGVTTPHLAKALKETAHAIIGWRVRPYDTLNRSSEEIVRTILRKTKPGDIILLHDTHERIVPVLEQLLPELKHRKFEMVTVENLIQQDAYTQD